MGISAYPAPEVVTKTMFRTTLISGTSWTVPAGVTYVNVTLVGGGAGGSGAASGWVQYLGMGGQVVSSTLSVTAGASITYAIGAGGLGVINANGGAGGDTTFTGATTALGANATQRASGNANAGGAARQGTPAYNGGGASDSAGGSTGGNGGAGCIYVEYWA
jgi:hypothetical protein